MTGAPAAMAITAAQVKELRNRTGAAMMECKKALEASAGDVEAAIVHLRKSGVAKAAKRAGRVAAEGVIVMAHDEPSGRIAMVEVNCETDFVGKDETFKRFADAVARTVLEARPRSLDEMHDAPLAGHDGETVESARTELVAKVGENINVRRFETIDADGATLGVYLHGQRIGVVVVMEAGESELARELAMHIAASRPVCVSEADVPQLLLERERDIFRAQAVESGKPAPVVEKMVEGRVKKFLGEVTLLGQPFIKDPEMSVGKLLSAKGAAVSRFFRFELGEGLEA
jgi:elongation factor Ts